MIALAWLAAALARPVPTVEVHAVGLAAQDPGSAVVGVGAGVTPGVRIWGPLQGELMLEAGWRATGEARVAAALGLRAFVLDPDRYRVRPSVSLAIGLDAVPDVQPLFQAGGAVDVAVAPDWALRFGAGVIARGVTPDVAPDAGRFTVGFLWRPAPPPRVWPGDLPEVPAPLVEPAPEIILPEDAMWLPYPDCDVVSPEEVARFLVEQDVARRAALAEALGVDEAEAEVTPDLGGVVVVAHVGDVVRLGDAPPVPAEADGTATLRAPQGGIEVEVVGGGRREALRVVVLAGQAVYVRVGSPDTARVRFPLGSSVLSRRGRAEVEALAANTGDWTWHLVGSWSPEGDPVRNRQLAEDRARAVAEALVAAGVPDDRVVLGTVDEPDPGLTAVDQRATKLEPVPPGGTP